MMAMQMPDTIDRLELVIAPYRHAGSFPCRSHPTSIGIVYVRVSAGTSNRS
jgi:hypothetical protein